MSSRRLVQRSRQNEESSPAPRAQQQSSNAGARQRAPGRAQPTPLPPYETPSCPLSAEARRELETLCLNHDYTKYKLHLQTSKTNLITTTADAFDRVALRKEKAEKETNKRRKIGVHEKSEDEIKAIEAAKTLESQALDVREKAEKALRQLIDYEDELAMNDRIMKDIIAKIPPPPAPERVVQPRERNEREDSDDEEAAEQGDEVIYKIPDVAGVSTLDLLKERKEEYVETYTSKSMRQRYDNTDYGAFIRTVHTARHGNEIPPPHARSWFTENGEPAEPTSGEQQADVDDDSDADLVISKATVNLKCPLTLLYFKEPYSNRLCTHSFEKRAILDHFHTNGTAPRARDARGRPIGPAGPKKVECPQSGCDKKFDPDDFFDDSYLARLVKRAQQDEAREDEEDENEEDAAPRGTQRSRPAQIDSDDVEVDDEAEQRRKHFAKIKKERGQSRGLSTAPSQAADSSMVIDDDEDEEDEEEEDDDDDSAE